MARRNRDKFNSIFVVGCLFIMAIAVISSILTTDDVDELCSTDGSMIQRIDGTWICVGNTTLNLNGGWENGGASIINGSLYAQTVYTYNLSSLNVTYENITVQNSFNVTGNFTVDASTFHVDSVSDQIGVGTTAPRKPLHVNSGLLKIENQ